MLPLTPIVPTCHTPMLAISLDLTGIVGSQGAHGRRLLAATGGLRGGLELLEDARHQTHEETHEDLTRTDSTDTRTDTQTLPLKNPLRTLSELSPNLLRTCSEPASNPLQTLSELAPNLLRTFSRSLGATSLHQEHHHLTCFRKPKQLSGKNLLGKTAKTFGPPLCAG